MSVSVMLRQAFLALFLATIATGSYAAASAKAKADFEPTVGQDGKDVVWVPTSQALVNRMLKLAKVTPNDTVIDLGSGDGRTVITAAQIGAKAIGVEYNPNMVALSKRNAAKAGVGEKAQFVNGDIFEYDFSKASVITLFLLPDLNVKLRPKILDMKPGTRIVSNSFTMGDWQADRTINVTEKEGCQSYCTAYLWIVPAKVEGRWKTADGDLVIKQNYQKVSGALERDGKTTQLSNGNLRADEFTFTAGGAQYTARVSGDTMKGTVKSGGNSREFTATRVGS